MSNLVKTEQQTEFLQTLIDSKKLPAHIKTVQDAFTVAQMGQELGFPMMQSMHYIIPIQGRLSLSAKAIGALLRRGGVEYTVLEDGMWVYPNGKTSKIREEGALDRRTTIEFTRNGKKETVDFLWTEAIEMGLTTKDNWIKLKRFMMYARCLAKGANIIGPDLLLGLYSTDELFDSFSVEESKVVRDEEGFIKEIKE